MKNYFEIPCGTLEISMIDHKMVAVVYDNDPYHGDKIDQPVKIYRGCITNYMGERGRVLWGWVSNPYFPDHILNGLKDGDSVFYNQEIHKIYDIKSGYRIF